MSARRAWGGKLLMRRRVQRCFTRHLVIVTNGVCLGQEAVDVAAGEADEQRDAAQNVAVRRAVVTAAAAVAVQLVAVQLQDLRHMVPVCAEAEESAVIPAPSKPTFQIP